MENQGILFLNFCENPGTYITERLLMGRKESNQKKIQMNKNFGHKMLNIFLSISLNICFGFTKEASR